MWHNNSNEGDDSAVNATTLQDLLQKARDAGMSYRAMEEKVARAEEKNPRGMKISRATANNIVRGVHRAPVTDEVIRAVAFIADVPDEVAFAAAGRRTNGPPFADELPAGVDDLEPNERRVALDLLRVLVAQRRELNRHDTDQPASDADRPPASGTPREDDEGEKTARVVHIKRDDLNEQQSSPETEPEERPEDAWAARKRDPRFKPDIPSADDIGEENQDPDDHDKK